jgi:hypothetical protein
MATFRTAHLQYAVPFDVNVVGTVPSGTDITALNRKSAIIAGDFVILTPATSTVPAYITKATAAQVAARQATHIVALTDMTMGGHVPTDQKDYRPSELVGATIAQAPVDASIPTKKVALYPIFDWSDIIPDADGLDALD